MILVDTSVWIDDLRKGNERLREHLREERVLCHPFVIGELACGSLRRRDEILELLAALPQAEQAEHYEVLRLVGSRRLHGAGLGWVDVHLLASALLSRCALWTLDLRLGAAAEKLGIGV